MVGDYFSVVVVGVYRTCGVGSGVEMMNLLERIIRYLVSLDGSWCLYKIPTRRK